MSPPQPQNVTDSQLPAFLRINKAPNSSSPTPYLNPSLVAPQAVTVTEGTRA